MRDISLAERRRILFARLPARLRREYDTQAGWIAGNIEMARIAIICARQALAHEQLLEAEAWVRAAWSILQEHALEPEIVLPPERCEP